MISALAFALGVREEWLRDGQEPIYEEESKLEDSDLAYRYLEESLGQFQNYIDDADYDALHLFATKRLGEMRAELGRKVGAIVKRGSGSTGREGAGNVININSSRVGSVVGGNQTIITDHHTTRVNNLPPAGSVAESQAREIHRLLVKIGELESLRIGPAGYGSVMNQFKNKFGLASYKNLPAASYDIAMEYLNRRTKTLEKVLLKGGKNPVTKADFIRRVQTICRRELKWNDPIRREKMMLRYGRPSLTQLSMAEIEDFYNYVSGLKARVK